MNRGKEIHHSLPQGLVTFYGAALGGGAAANGTIPADGVLEAGSAGLYPKRVNHASALTYNAATGLYLFTYISDMHVKNIIDAKGSVVDAGAAPTTALVCVVTELRPATRTIAVRIYTPAGVLTDLGTSDLLVMRMEGWDSTG